MRYRIIVSRVLFDFAVCGHGRLRLRSVRFLDDSEIREKDAVLLVRVEGEEHSFLNSATPMACLSREQFRFVAAAARFFGYLPDQEMRRIWVWTDTLQETPGRMAASGSAMGRRKGRVSAAGGLATPAALPL